MDSQDLSDIVFAFKRQTAVGSPESGADAFGLELLPSQGLAAQAQSIASGLIKRNKMKRRSRRGSQNTTANYESEISKDCFEGLGPAVLGAEDWTAEQSFDNTDFTNVTISGGGITLTFGGGDLVAAGLVAGQFIRFGNLSVAGNNGKWVPILTVGGAGNRVMTVPAGYFADNALDAAFDLTVARHVLTPSVYGNYVYSVEEYLKTIDRSKFAQDIRFNSLVFSESPTAFPKFSFGVAGRALEMKAAGGPSPVFTDPTYPSGESLILLDGGVFLSGAKRLNLTALTFGITAPVSSTAVIGSLTGPPAKIGDFEFAGSVSGVVEDGDDFDAFEADDDVSLLAHYKDKQDESGIGIYAGNLGYSSYGSPASGQGDQVQTLALYGGDDDRGDGYAPTTLLISDLSE